jgi:hypothetical protein
MKTICKKEKKMAITGFTILMEKELLQIKGGDDPKSGGDGAPTLKDIVLITTP